MAIDLTNGMFAFNIGYLTPDREAVSMAGSGTVADPIIFSNSRNQQLTDLTISEINDYVRLTGLAGASSNVTGKVVVADILGLGKPSLYELSASGNSLYINAFRPNAAGTAAMLLGAQYGVGIAQTDTYANMGSTFNTAADVGININHAMPPIANTFDFLIDMDKIINNGKFTINRFMVQALYALVDNSTYNTSCPADMYMHITNTHDSLDYDMFKATKAAADANITLLKKMSQGATATSSTQAVEAGTNNRVYDLASSSGYGPMSTAQVQAAYGSTGKTKLSFHSAYTGDKATQMYISFPHLYLNFTRIV